MNKKKKPQSHGIPLKKQFGQHFLRDRSVVDCMINRVEISPQVSVFEIGCGDGFLTEAILEQEIARLWIFEIDSEWAQFVREKFPDPRLTVNLENFLDVNFDRLEEYKPWTVLANLPYQVSFPIMYRFQEQRHLIKEGVVMVQEEVAQKIVKTGGRGYGFPALFLQRYFEFELLNKIPPQAFYPAPKVVSRLLYFKPRSHVQEIPHEQEFWKFIKICFRQPRRTLRNNLAQAHYDSSMISDQILSLRSQQMGMDDFLAVWNVLRI